MLIRSPSLPPPSVAPATEKPAQTAAGESFGDVLQSSVEKVRDSLEAADGAAVDAMVGDGQPHEAMMAMAKADLAFRFLSQTRNKVVEAYNQIMNMQL